MAMIAGERVVVYLTKASFSSLSPRQFGRVRASGLSAHSESNNAIIVNLFDSPGEPKSSES